MGVAEAVATLYSVTDTPGVTYEQVRQRIVDRHSEVGVLLRTPPANSG